MQRTPSLLTIGFLAACVLAAPHVAAGQAVRAPAIARATPEEVGLSRATLDGIGPAMQELVDRGRTGGVMTLVARTGKLVHWEAHGWRVLGEDPLEPTDIFRIYSMTKPVTSVAVMMLVENGELSLDDPVATFIPAFAGVEVYVSPDERRPPSRSITIRDLLTHTSGLTYGQFGDTPVDSIYRREGIGVQGTVGDLEQTVDAIAGAPLLADPGSRWNYSVSTDVLGRVVEIVSGETLDAYFRDEIFEPLGMVDTGFHVPADKLDRFVAVYGPGQDGLRMIDSPRDGPFTRPPVWLSGGGGLTSTAMDYLRFSQMLLNGGELDGVRLLEPETVRAMRTNQLPDALMPITFFPDNGFGLGFAVSVGANPGVYWWLGVANTYFWIDPTEDIVAFAWTQYMPVGGQPIDRMLRQIVYQAIVGS